jgi:alpha-tubulin suppressor-like RCC1 family protein
LASVSAGNYQTCAVTTAGGLKCGGSDYYGQLGNDAALTNQPTPKRIAAWTCKQINRSSLYAGILIPPLAGSLAMKLHSLRVAAALTAALTTAVSPLLVSAQTAYEYKAYKQGLVVTGAATAPGPGPVTPPPQSPQPALQLSTSAINFGDVATNTTETRQVLVSNAGTGSLSFTAAPAVTGDAAFAAGLTTCGATLAAGADCLTDATFSPTTVGTYNGVLKFTSVLASSPHEVTLVGAAFNPVSLAATTLPDGKVGQAYSYDFKQLLNISNETSPDKSLATWSGSGALPTGLSFNTGTGVLSGTPSVLSTGAEYTVTGTYKNNQGQQVYTIKVGEAMLEVVQVAAGTYHTCAVTTAGGLKCWGYDYYGQLGNDIAKIRQPTPVDVLGLTSGVARVAAGDNHTCAVTTAGGLKCWGHDGSGQLGNDAVTVDQPTPVDVWGLTSGVASVSAGGVHTCAVTTAGGLKCWGHDGSGQLGNDAAQTNQPTPVDVWGLTSGVASVSAGGVHTCAVTTAGGLKCWGNDSQGQLGNDAALTSKLTPVDVMGLTSGVSNVSLGLYHTCAVTTAGGLKCWGRDNYGQLGNDAALANQPTPVDVSGLTYGVAGVAAGEYHTCAVTNAGGLKCWGYDYYGQLGNDAAKIDQPTPVDVLGQTSGVASVSAGTFHTCAVTNAGGLKCWGSDSQGQLGNDTATVNQPTPVNVAP